MTDFSDSLSKREQEVNAYFAKGFSDREIAAGLNLSRHTVRNYRDRIAHKKAAYLRRIGTSMSIDNCVRKDIPIDRLSKREKEIVQCISEGLTNRETAVRLDIDVHTVKNYLIRIHGKLGTQNRSQLPTLDRIEEAATPVDLGSLEAPPRLPRLLLLLIPKNNREHLLGDLEEEYRTVLLPELGVSEAKLRYWWQVSMSIAAILIIQLRRATGLAWLWKRGAL